MKAWPIQDAKARFSELVERCAIEGPQMVTKRGAEKAVLVPIEEWRRLAQLRSYTVKDWLMDPRGRGDFEIPSRKGFRLRPPPDFDE